MSPHILVVTVDSLRADYLRCYGRREIHTPNLDAFAASGVQFDHHLSTLSATLPSHCSLLTGCVPSVHGVNWNNVKTPRRRRTLAELAADHGYATTAITSWGGFQKQQVFGFQETHSKGGAGAEDNRGDITIARVEAWLDRVDASNPQLLWVHIIDPHTPDNCPAPHPQTYEGEVEFVDTLIARLIQGWDANLGSDNSLAVLTADHGEHLNDHGIERGHGTLWITNMWIPLLIRRPGIIKPRSRVDELTRQIDVLPTILDYCNLPMPYDIQGMSLRGTIEGRDSEMRLVHQGQIVYEDVNTMTVRTENFSFHFGDNDDLARAFDRRVDAHEEENLLVSDGEIRHSVEHSLKDGREK